MTVESRGESSTDISRIIGSSQESLTKDEIDRLFEKRTQAENRIEQMHQKLAQDWYRDEQLRRKVYGPKNDLVTQDRNLRADQRSQVVAAKFEAYEVEKSLLERRKEKHHKMLKRGILEGAIQIHETDDGFEIDTPPEKIAEYFLKHFRSNLRPPHKSDLAKGKFLLGTVDNVHKRRIANLRQNLIQEYQPKTATDLMLIDLAASNYARCMFATKLETECLWLAHDHVLEMFDVAVDGLQPYVHGCQNQLLKVLSVLSNRKLNQRSGLWFTHRTYSRTDINLQNWGLPLLYALAEITQKKESRISVNEIKQTMLKSLPGVSSDDIQNDDIGYALRDLGFTDCLHTSIGNVYKIPKQSVQVLLNEALKG